MKIQHLDYSEHIPNMGFEYDPDFYPENLHDPQINPVIPGARVGLTKVGVSGVDLPIKLVRRDGSVQQVHAKTSLYGSLDDPNAKGLNLSRFPIVMHEAIADNLSIDGLRNVLAKLAEKQGSKHAYCKMKFKYPWTQEALRSRQPAGEDETPWRVVDGIRLSNRKMVGHIFYDCILEGQWHEGEYKFYLTVDYVYSSACPCSSTLAHQAINERGKMAVGHSQRSIAKITVEFDPAKIVFIEDVVELARTKVPTEVLIICKRIDEQAFAELNGSNLIFTEDACRLLYEGLDGWFESEKILDFSIVTDHIESLHPWNATAVVSKGLPGGLR